MEVSCRPTGETETDDDNLVIGITSIKKQTEARRRERSFPNSPGPDSFAKNLISVVETRVIIQVGEAANGTTPAKRRPLLTRSGLARYHQKERVRGGLANDLYLLEF